MKEGEFQFSLSISPSHSLIHYTHKEKNYLLLYQLFAWTSVVGDLISPNKVHFTFS